MNLLAEEPALPPKQAPRWRLLFVSSRGLRAGWCLVIFILAYLGLETLLTKAVHSQHWLDSAILLARQGVLTAKLVLVEDGISGIALVLAMALMGKIQRQSLGEYGLPGRKAFRHQFRSGLLWGFAGSTLLISLIFVSHGYSFGTLANGVWSTAASGLLWALVNIVVALYEESLFRGYIQSTLSGSIGFWPAAVFSSLLFGGAHLENFGETWVGGLAAFVFGMFLCLTLRRTGSLWFAVGTHAAWNYALVFIYSATDSGFVAQGHLLRSSFQGPHWLTGGSFGPEGSAFVFPVIVCLFASFARIHKKQDTTM